MVTVYQVMASTCGAIVGVFVYVLIDRIRNARTNAKAVKEADTMLNDTSYIQDMKHLSLTVQAHWNLLGYDATNEAPTVLPLASIMSLSTAYGIEFIPNDELPLQDFNNKNDISV